MHRLILAAAAAALIAGPALAEDCTEEMAGAKSEELFQVLEANPGQGEKLEQYVAEVEAEYGGREPTLAETCEAIQKLIDKVLADAAQ